MDTEEIIQTLKQVRDYLAPLQTPYEQAIYNYLFRWSYLETGERSVRKGKRTIAAESGAPRFGSSISYAAVDENLRSLEKKGHIRIGDVTREGTLYTILLPIEIPECIRLMHERHQLPEGPPDYFGDPAKRREIFERDQWVCHYCGEEVTEENACLDHLIPRSKGGESTWNNLVTSCLECNSIKSGKTYEEAAPLLLERIKQRRMRRAKDKER
ncbi:MAG TPA: hypothetical protein DCP08_09255 [Chloroflexi bacterium]|nr:hypothetical protein [Chloroflexota bacterium]